MHVQHGQIGQGFEYVKVSSGIMKPRPVQHELLQARAPCQMLYAGDVSTPAKIQTPQATQVLGVDGGCQIGPTMGRSGK